MYQNRWDYCWDEHVVVFQLLMVPRDHLLIFLPVYQTQRSSGIDIASSNGTLVNTAQ